MNNNFMENKLKGGLRAAYFRIPALSYETFGGFTKGEKWDEWDCPYFTYEQARRILKIYNEPFLVLWQTYSAFYDFTSNAFVFPNDYEPEIYRAITEDGQKYYQIGTYCWFWEEVSKLDSI